MHRVCKFASFIDLIIIYPASTECQAEDKQDQTPGLVELRGGKKKKEKMNMYMYNIMSQNSNFYEVKEKKWKGVMGGLLGEGTF